MKIALWIIIPLCFIGCVKSESKNSRPSVEQLLAKVKVGKSHLDLSKQRKPVYNIDILGEPDDDFAWDKYVNKPYEKQFSKLSCIDWQTNWIKFRDVLVAKAKKKKYDSDSLAKILDGLRPRPEDKTSSIPIGAFTARNGPDGVWIILFKWDYYLNKKSKDGYRISALLRHLEIRSYLMKNGELLESNKCR